MQLENVWRKFETLPPAAQKEVIDFIDFLQTRHGKRKGKIKPVGASLMEEEFVGMWKDHEDMADSSRWVKKLRQTEWKKGSESNAD